MPFFCIRVVKRMLARHIKRPRATRQGGFPWALLGSTSGQLSPCWNPARPREEGREPQVWLQRSRFGRKQVSAGEWTPH